MHVTPSLHRPGVGRQLWLAAISAACYLGTASVTAALTGGNRGALSVWPANATVLALMIVLGRVRADRLALAAGMAFGTALAAAARHYPPLFWLMFPIADICETLAAAAIIRRGGTGTAVFHRVGGVVALVAACLVAPLLSASIGALAVYVHTAAPVWRAWTIWYLSGALNLAITAPLLAVAWDFVGQLRRRTMGRRKAGELALLVAGVTVITCAIFLFGSVPALWIIPPLLLIAAFRLRQLGAATSVALVALVAAIATAKGFGPIAAISPTPWVQVTLLQFFLATTFMSALPVAAALTERDARAAEAQLMAARYRAVVDNVDEVIFRIDRQGRWTYLNPAWKALSGFAIDASLGRNWLERVDPAAKDELAAWAEPVFAGEVRATRRLLRFRTSEGALRWMELSIQALHDPDGKVLGATGMLRDVHERKRLEEHVLLAKRQAEERAREAALLAATDELTGLANRRAFLHDLDRQVAAAAEFGWPLSLAIFDIDHFKLVNDRYGHPIGDRVLCRTADRARDVVRGGDLIGRLGGEEFAILMPGAGAEDAAAVAERLRDAVQRPSRCNEPEALPRVTVSVGIALLQPRQGADGLLTAADVALYEAKAAGRNRVELAG